MAWSWVGTSLYPYTPEARITRDHNVREVALRVIARTQRHTECEAVAELVEKERPTVVAIDSPQCCAPMGRSARDGERQVAKSIRGTRWTPDERHVYASAYHAWIVEGLTFFHALATCDVEVIEVFPTASWTRWHGKRVQSNALCVEQTGLGDPRSGVSQSLAQTPSHSVAKLCGRARGSAPRTAAGLLSTP